MTNAGAGALPSIAVAIDGVEASCANCIWDNGRFRICDFVGAGGETIPIGEPRGGSEMDLVMEMGEAEGEGKDWRVAGGVFASFGEKLRGLLRGDRRGDGGGEPDFDEEPPTLPRLEILFSKGVATNWPGALSKVEALLLRGGGELVSSATINSGVNVSVNAAISGR